MFSRDKLLIRFITEHGMQCSCGSLLLCLQFQEPQRQSVPDFDQTCVTAIEQHGWRNAIERVSRSFDGFFFGRYDVRSPSLQDFRLGRFRVIELNGVTSEATSIYDPSYGPIDAYRTLFAQWRLAFAIGAENRERGVAPAKIGHLARLIGRYRESSGGHL